MTPAHTATAAAYRDYEAMLTFQNDRQHFLAKHVNLLLKTALFIFQVPILA